MITTATKVVGNIYKDPAIGEKYEDILQRDLVDVLPVSRTEVQLSRFKKKTAAGHEFIIDLPRGTTLRHGDVLWLDQDNMVVIQTEPEEVMSIYIIPEGPLEKQLETVLNVGHILGNHHLQVGLKHRTVHVSMVTVTNKEVLMSTIVNIGGIDVKFEKLRFESF